MKWQKNVGWVMLMRKIDSYEMLRTNEILKTWNAESYIYIYSFIEAYLIRGLGKCSTPYPFKFSTTLFIILRFLCHVIVMKWNENDWIVFLERKNELCLQDREWYQMNYAFMTGY
jgi:hypothetical protein